MISSVVVESRRELIGGVNARCRIRSSKALTSERSAALSTAHLASQATGGGEVSSDTEFSRDAATDPARVVLAAGACSGAFEGLAQLEVMWVITTRRLSEIVLE